MFDHLPEQENARAENEGDLNKAGQRLRLDDAAGHHQPEHLGEDDVALLQGEDVGGQQHLPRLAAAQERILERLGDVRITVLARLVIEHLAVRGAHPLVVEAALERLGVDRDRQRLVEGLRDLHRAVDSLEIVSKTSNNYTIEKAILYVREKISEGQNMVDPLTETKMFPHMVVQMIGVGESTGALDTMLNKIADFYEDEVDVAVDNLTSLMEPLLMVFLGIVVGGMLIAMYLPIFSLAGNIKSE